MGRKGEFAVSPILRFPVSGKGEIKEDGGKLYDPKIVDARLVLFEGSLTFRVGSVRERSSSKTLAKV